MKRNYIICLFALLATIGICSCEKQANETTYKGNVVNSLTHEAFPNLEVSVTDGTHINQTVHTDAQGLFSVLVRFDEINSQYYLLVGDSSCVPARRDFKGFGQAEVDLGIIEVEGPKAPMVTTAQVTAITAETAVSGGNVTDDGRATVTARGVCWSKNEYPTTADAHTSNGTGKGEFQSNLTGLEFGQKYYLRAYATNRMGTAYGEQVSFSTSTGEAEVVTDSVFAITATSAKCAGTVVGDGNYPIMARGVCWSTSPTPTTTDFFSNDIGTKGPFVCALRDLDVSTTYYVRAYATNANGTMYGEQIPFTTLDGLATVTTAQATSTALTISAGGQVVNNGGFVVTERGVCYSATNTEPSISDEKVISGKGNGTFNATISGLTAATTYYLRAYATNENGTAYGMVVTIKTKDGAPVLSTTTTTATSITISSGGNITSDGGYAITARGVCYSSTNSTPTLTDQYTTAGIGTGSFSTIITNVSVSTTYYVRAYATNSITTTYGNVIAVTTGNGLPIVVTTTPTITDSVVSTGGQVTDDGGFSIIARGICYGTFPYPDLTNTYLHTTNGTGAGYYTSTFSLPIGSGMYYVRAYATNANGTSYGQQFSVVQPYDTLPSFVYNGHKYRVAPAANNTLSWVNANTYCNNLTLYGYTDWRLPTKDELLQMYNDRYSIKGFGTGSWWSSSIASSYYSYYIVIFYDGSLVSRDEDNRYEVRPIRVEN